MPTRATQKESLQHPFASLRGPGLAVQSRRVNFKEWGGILKRTLLWEYNGFGLWFETQLFQLSTWNTSALRSNSIWQSEARALESREGKTEGFVPKLKASGY